MDSIVKAFEARINLEGGFIDMKALKISYKRSHPSAIVSDRYIPYAPLLNRGPAIYLKDRIFVAEHFENGIVLMDDYRHKMIPFEIYRHTKLDKFVDYYWYDENNNKKNGTSSIYEIRTSYMFYLSVGWLNNLKNDDFISNNDAILKILCSEDEKILKPLDLENNAANLAAYKFIRQSEPVGEWMCETIDIPIQEISDDTMVCAIINKFQEYESEKNTDTNKTIIRQNISKIMNAI